MALATALPADVSAPAPVPWLRMFLAGEGRAWVFVLKSLLAIYLAAWLAMWLRLEQPATSMISVTLVMHPHSGMVLAKSFYRALGTLAGSVCGVSLMALFPQQRELFLGSLSLWVALCAGGAMLYRNFMSYGFVLAGYTAAIVVLPAIDHPLGVFDSAVMRVSEVLLGIVVAALVSDLVWPQRLRRLLRQSAQSQFTGFVALVRESADGGLARPRIEQAHLAAVAAALRLEDLRASVIFEDPEARTRSGHIRTLNQRFMAAATSLQSLHHLLNRMRREGLVEPADALLALYRPIGASLDASPHSPDPAIMATRLRAYTDGLPAQAATWRAHVGTPQTLLEFDTGAAMLQRFAGELADLAAAYASLDTGRLRGRVERVHFRRGNDHAGAWVAVLRTFLTMATLSAFWLASGWTFGSSAMLLATIFSGLLAASPRPVGAALRTLGGYAAGTVAAFAVVFGLLPGSDGFAMLIAASAGLLLIGPYLSSRESLAGLGAGYSLGFVYMLALKNPMVYDPAHFLNDAAAQLAGVALAGLAFVIVPAITGSGWQHWRQLRRLRQQVAMAASTPLEGLRWRFESVSRDLFQQLVAYTAAASDASRDPLAWSLAVQETGRIVIELRLALAATTLSPELRVATAKAVQAVAELYVHPDAARALNADRRVQDAIALAAAAPMVRLHLHALRGALRDDAAPFADLTRAPALEPSHAA